MINPKVDISGFFKQIDKDKKELYETIIKVIKKVAFDGFAKVIQDSPIETGRFKSSWLVSINHKDEDKVYSPGKRIRWSETTATNLSMRRLGKIENYKLGDLLSLVNNTEYGVYIEYGSPKTAATAMVKLNSQLMQMKIDEAIKALR